MHGDTLYTMEKPAHEWRVIVAHCVETGQQGLRDLIRPHLVGRADDEEVVIRAPLTVVGLVTTIVGEMEPVERPDTQAAAPDQIAVGAGADPGSVILDVVVAGQRRPTRIALNRDQARKLARSITAIADPGR